MKCVLCGIESDNVKRIHLDNYNLDGELCPQCYQMVTSRYLKDETPAPENTIEQVDDDVFVDESNQPLPQGVPKFKITDDHETHYFGLMSFKREQADLTKWFYRAIEIYPKDQIKDSHYTNEYHFNTYPSESQDQSDERRIKAYDQLKAKTAADIAYKTLKDDSLSDTGTIKIENDHYVIDGHSYTINELNDYLSSSEGWTLNYSLKNEEASHLNENTVLIPEDIDDEYFYNELFDIMISFSTLENFIPLDNVQKFSLFYRKLLKKFRSYLQIKPEDAYLQAFMMMDLLKEMTSDDEYFPEVCKNELRKLLLSY